MLRLRSLAMLVVLLGVACSSAQQQVVSSFLTAVQTGNEDAAKAASLVEFPGGVESWEIVEVGPVSSEPFAFAALQVKLSELSRERRAEKDNNAYFVQNHQSAFDKYTAKHEKDPEYEFSGEVAEFQKEWEEKRRAAEELDRAATEVYKEMSHLKSAAGLSLSTTVNENFEGETSATDLILKVNDGSTEKTYMFTLQKFDLIDTERNISPIGRWVITDIEEQA
ncbi:MAG: hypothetical protein BMS9Abin37_2606 [Acidobacteriota bacterium]|nr:MAG: hypothetical protein BMS9Abin37_2606 [Acidobacteriota bacterium]